MVFGFRVEGFREGKKPIGDMITCRPRLPGLCGAAHRKSWIFLSRTSHCVWAPLEDCHVRSSGSSSRLLRMLHSYKPMPNLLRAVIQ